MIRVQPLFARYVFAFFLESRVEGILELGVVDYGKSF